MNLTRPVVEAPAGRPILHDALQHFYDRHAGIRVTENILHNMRKEIDYYNRIYEDVLKGAKIVMSPATIDEAFAGVGFDLKFVVTGKIDASV